MLLTKSVFGKLEKDLILLTRKLQISKEDIVRHRIMWSLVLPDRGNWSPIVLFNNFILKRQNVRPGEDSSFFQWNWLEPKLEDIESLINPHVPCQLLLTVVSHNCNTKELRNFYNTLKKGYQTQCPRQLGSLFRRYLFHSCFRHKLVFDHFFHQGANLVFISPNE